jgi:N-acetylmuramoyl-L-alanine amidase
MAGGCAYLAIAASSLLAQSAGSGHVTAVRHWSLGDVTRIAIEVEADSDFHVRSDRLENPDRLFFDIVGAAPRLGKRGVRVISVGDAFVRQIRVAETQRDVTRVVLDLEGPVEFTTSQLENPNRLMIEIHAPGHVPAAPKLESATLTQSPQPASPVRESTNPVERRTFQPPVIPKAQQRPADVALLDAPPAIEATPPKAASIASASPRIPAPATPRPGRASAAVLAKATPPPSATTTTPSSLVSDLPVPARRNSSGDRSMVRVLGLKVGRIVLDAGHGGHDTGTIGPGGLAEKDLVLDVTRRLGALIDERLGAEVIYTRNDDTFIPLERRTEIANDAKADLFLSIHANSSPLRTAAGVETYYLSFTTAKTALDVAARENASSEKSIYELQDLLQKIALKDKVDESHDFATRVQDALYSASVKTNPRARDRGVRKAPFVVLIGASMPSVLAEIGFISNTHDENLMSRPEHRQRIAEALYKGLASYAATLSHFQVAQRRP